MRSFLKKTAAFLLIMAVIVLSINALYEHMDLSDKDNTNKFRSVPKGIEICNLGASHGLLGFNYENVEDHTCFNFALVAQSLSYDKIILNHYKDHIKKGAVVFIPVSFFTLFGSDETEDAEFEEKNKRYYKFLKPSEVKEFDFETYLFTRYLRSTTDIEDLFTVLSGGTRADFYDRWGMIATPESAFEAAYLTYQNQIAVSRNESYERDINENEVEALKGIIALCNEIGAKPVLITVPVLKEFTDTINYEDPEFMDDFHKIMDDIVKETGAEYHDYSCDERFCTNYMYFMELDHMNRTGAEAFTDMLLDTYL
ncbi:MAG: hypothetical protein K6A69_00505 [Lachnospiraceae bacterium]|nr:hypothetical protein [Lachnospiraceae bacterium]